MVTESARSGATAEHSLRAAVNAATADYVTRNPKSREVAAVAARSLPGGNTRSSLWHDPFPLCMIRGEGSRLTDADGNEYVDFLGEYTAGIYGHSPGVIKTAITQALESGINLSAHNRLESQLAAAICSRFPSMELVRFTNSGTEANLMALAAACAVTHRSTILVFDGAYHGSVLNFPAGSAPLNVPHQFIVAPYNDLEATSTLIRAHASELAAILVEPMLGAGGCIPADRGFLEFVRARATEVGAVLIFDEIQTSRLSVGGRQMLLDVRPDMTTLGKFFGGGLAFGCFGGARHIMEMFDPRRPDALAHAGTFNNNSLTMAAGLAGVTSLLTAEALRDLNSRGDRLRNGLQQLFERTGAPFTVSGLGSLMNIHPAAPSEQVSDLRKLLFFDLAADGLYIAARGLIALSLCIDDAEVTRFLSASAAFLERRRALFPG
jgi:glutamate-1-semialdehyde 2,1-aminomutase